MPQKPLRDRWKEADDAERRKLILRALRRGKTIQTLAGLLNAEKVIVEEYLSEMRETGQLLCTNKLWYRRDLKPEPPKPKAPRTPTGAELRFLARQGRLF